MAAIVAKYKIGDRLAWDGPPVAERETIGVVLAVEFRNREPPEHSGWYYEMDTTDRPWIWEDLLRVPIS